MTNFRRALRGIGWLFIGFATLMVLDSIFMMLCDNSLFVSGNEWVWYPSLEWGGFIVHRWIMAAGAMTVVLYLWHGGVRRRCHVCIGAVLRVLWGPFAGKYRKIPRVMRLVNAALLVVVFGAAISAQVHAYGYWAWREFIFGDNQWGRVDWADLGRAAPGAGVYALMVAGVTWIGAAVLAGRWRGLAAMLVMVCVLTLLDAGCLVYELIMATRSYLVWVMWPWMVVQLILVPLGVWLVMYMLGQGGRFGVGGDAGCDATDLS
ncbi:MAG: hypothetical protein WC058_00825 [Phycisphaeraceae bacterium]